jgi:hypothetical protein
MKIIVGSFETEQKLVEALPRLRDAGLGYLETYTPGFVQNAHAKPSALPLVVLIAGVLGMIGSFLLQSYATMVSYPVNIGGRPAFSWPAFVPVAFENGILAAVLAGFVGFLVVNRLPSLYRPEDEAMLLRHASRNRWCVAIRTEMPERAQSILGEMTEDIEEVPA